MIRVLEAVRRWASSPYTELALGVFVVACGLVQLGTEEGVGAHHGLALLGGFQILRAVDGLLEGGELAGKALSSLEVPSHRSWSSWLRRLLHSAVFRVGLGSAIFLAALADAWEDLENGLAMASGHWKLGVMLIGVLVLGEALAGLRLGLQALGPTWLLLERTEGKLRRPWVEVSVAAAVLALAVMEELRTELVQVRGHLGLMALGAHRLVALAPRLRTSAVLVKDAVQRREEGNR